MQTPATAEIKNYSGSGFSKIFHSGFGSGQKKTQNPSAVDSGSSDPWPPLPCIPEMIG